LGFTNREAECLAVLFTFYTSYLKIKEHLLILIDGHYTKIVIFFFNLQVVRIVLSTDKSTQTIRKISHMSTVRYTGRYFGFVAGPSGVGKGFGLGQVLNEYFGARIFVTGDWCRDHENGHAEGGTLAPDERLIEAIAQDYNHHQPMKFLVDAPRTLVQVQRLIGLFRKWDKEAVIITAHITADRHSCEARIRHRATQQGRSDDAEPHIIKRRLDVYFEKGGISQTVIPFLKSNTRYVPIDGNMSLELIRKKVRDQHGPALFGA